MHIFSFQSLALLKLNTAAMLEILNGTIYLNLRLNSEYSYRQKLKTSDIITVKYS